MIDQRTINRAVGLLLGAVPPGSQVTLFGSYVKGCANEDSELAFLVIEPTLQRRREDMVRLRQVLRPLGISVTILVVSQRVFDAWRDLPNNVISEAAQEGRTFVDVP